MIYVGIDPGKKGAIVAINDAGGMELCVELPFLEDGSADYPGLLEIFENINSRFYMQKVMVALERAIPMAMGAKHAFTYGKDFAAIEIALREKHMSVQYVEPSKWPKVICEGIDKDLKPKVRSATAVRRLFPSLIDKIPCTPKSKALHEGVVDALLLAEFLRRQGLLSS